MIREPFALPASDSVHVWQVPLETRGEGEEFASWLSADERQRADRFRFARDRRRFIVARGGLRRVLAGYLGVDPSAIEFDYAELGKPNLRQSGVDSGLRFNLSHSGELALIAVTPGRELGIDIERTREIPDALPVARRFFSVAEQERLKGRPECDRVAEFLRIWTRKEAYLKALGRGIGYPLERFQVRRGQNDELELIVEDDPGETARWTVRDLAAPSEYHAAICVEGPIESVERFDFDDRFPA